MPVSWPRAWDNSARTPQLGRMSPGREALGRTRCRRPSGCVTVPSFSAWVSSGKTTSALAVVAFSKVEKTTRCFVARQGSVPSLGVREVAEGVDAEEDQRLELAGLEQRDRPVSMPRARSRLARSPAASSLPPQSRAGVGKAAGLAQAAGVGEVGNLQQPTSSFPLQAERPRQIKQGVDSSFPFAPDPLAPDHDDPLGPLEHVGGCRHPLRTFCAGGAGSLGRQPFNVTSTSCE